MTCQQNNKKQVELFRPKITRMCQIERGRETPWTAPSSPLLKKILFPKKELWLRKSLFPIPSGVCHV